MGSEEVLENIAGEVFDVFGMPETAMDQVEVKIGKTYNNMDTKVNIDNSLEMENEEKKKLSKFSIQDFAGLMD